MEVRVTRRDCELVKTVEVIVARERTGKEAVVVTVRVIGREFERMVCVIVA